MDQAKVKQTIEELNTIAALIGQQLGLLGQVVAVAQQKLQVLNQLLGEVEHE